MGTHTTYTYHTNMYIYQGVVGPGKRDSIHVNALLSDAVPLLSTHHTLIYVPVCVVSVCRMIASESKAFTWELIRHTLTTQACTYIRMWWVERSGAATESKAFTWELMRHTLPTGTIPHTIHVTLHANVVRCDVFQHI
jgi:hypothetical protein